MDLRAEIVSVGTELLLGQIVDTDAAYLARALSQYGVSVYRRVTIGDNHDRLLAVLREAVEQNDVVFTIGGLGPTMDDISRETLAEAMGDTLHMDEGIADGLRQFFAKRGMSVLESNLRQAYVPDHGRAIPNPNGTAPGILIEMGGKTGIALPGPPNEFVPMVDSQIIPWLEQMTGGRTIRSRVLRVCGMGESVAEDRLKDLMASEAPTVAPYAKTGEVHLRVTARESSAEAADALIEPMVARIIERLGDHVYAFDDETLEAAVVRLLTAHGLTVAVCESCTGGLLGSRITDVPGSSAAFLGGAITYTNAAKTDLAAVPADLIAAHGAVSPEVACAMADGIRRRFGADYGIGITGVAGPDGGTPEKPVGLVYVAVADADGAEAERCLFFGRRRDVRWRSTQTALVQLRTRVLARARG
ncbi:MAG: competence/damage-inducible protein A [Armatimonadetes bacterium]|nr:competence/damage-inducible protein A [Armatimonadota bacterium]